MGIRRAISTCVVIFAAFSAPCVAQDDAAATKLFEDTWREAQDFKLTPGYVYEWDALWYPSLTDGELTALTIEVGRKPDHPKRSVLDAEQRRRKNGPDKIERRLYYLDDRHWRLNETNIVDSMFVDVASMPDIVWALSPMSLTIEDPKSPPPGRDYQRRAEAISSEIARFAWGPFGTRAYEETRIIRARHEGIQWMGRYESGNYQFELECVVENGLLRTQSSGQDREDAGSKIFGRTFRYSDFREEAAFTVPAAHRVEGVSTEGRVLTAFTLKAIRALPTSEFSEISRIPDPGSADAIRGDVKFTTIVDFRPGAETITAKTPAGDRVSAIPRAQLGRPSSSSLRHVGWWSIAGVIGALVGIRVWRSTRAL